MEAEQQPIPAEMLRDAFMTTFEILEQLIHEIGDPPHIVKKFNSLMLAVAGKQ